MANKKSQTHQIKITLTEENYKKLQQSAEKNYRTISQEVNYRLNQLLNRPGGLDAPMPIIYPAGVRTINPEPGIPETPYKVICDTAENERPKSKTVTFTTGNKNNNLLNQE